MQLMHVKCIHELCSLLSHIPTHLHHISSYTNVLNDFGDFLNNPLSFGSNSVWQKCIFLVFLTFQELQDSEKGKVRGHGSQISRRIQHYYRNAHP